MTSFLRTTAASSVIALLLSGCSLFSDSSKKPTALPELGAANTFKAAWQASVGKAGEYFFQPAIVDGKVFVAGYDGTISAFDEATGKSVARFESRQRLTAGVGAFADNVAVVTERGEVSLYDGVGKLKWSVPIGGEVLAAPAVNADLVVIRTTDGRVMGFKVADGKRAWLYSRPMPALTLRTSAGMLLTRGEVIMGVPGGRVIVLDQEAGRLLAEFTFANPKGASELERVADVSGLPILEDRRMCAVTFQGRVGCLDVSNSTTIWAKDASSAVGVGADASNLYVSGEDGSIQALAKDGGASVWKNAQLKNRTFSTPVPTSTGIVVGDQLGNVLLLNKDNGGIIGRATTDGSAVQAIVPSGSGAVVITRSGAVVSFK
jgi:outer membrane protein assembly factor BamB